MTPKRAESHFRLDPRCSSILESVRDENLLPSLNTALNFLIRDYRRLKDNHNGSNRPTVGQKVDKLNS